MTVKLAPVPRQQYVDSSGNPYSGAKLFYYAAGTSTKQNTYTTSVGDTANTNPIVLDSSGRTPYGVWLTEGVNYKVVLAPASDTDPPTSPIFTEDVITGINSEDTASQWVPSGVTPTYVSATQFTVAGDKTGTFLVDRRVKCTVTAGTVYGYISASAYTTLTTVTVVLDSGSLDSGLSAVEVGILTDTNSAIPLTVAKRNAANNYTNAQNEAKGADIASAATINLTTATGNLVHVTGTTTITAITLASGAERTVVFDGILTLTHNATTLILPGGQNITTAAGDRMIVRGDGSGNARVIAYIPATGYPVNMAKGADIASAATVNLDAATGDFVHITGTTTITAITLASGKEATVVFDGILTLTHNATTLILPGGANITTAAGDRAIFRGDGSGNVRCIDYIKANGKSVVLSIPQATTAQIGMPFIAASTAIGDVVLDVLNPQFIRTSTAAAAPNSAQLLYGDGWRTASETITLLSTTNISSGVGSVSISLPTGYAQHQIEVTNLRGTIRQDAYWQKNGLTAGVFYDSVTEIKPDAGASANVNCASISLSPSTFGAHNASALLMQNTAILGTNPEGGGTITLTLDNITGTAGQTLRGRTFAHPTRTATVSSAVHTLVATVFDGMAKSTAKMTAISILPAAGTFEGGTITLKGVKR